MNTEVLDYSDAVIASQAAKIMRLESRLALAEKVVEAAVSVSAAWNAEKNEREVNARVGVLSAALSAIRAMEAKP